MEYLLVNVFIALIFLVGMKEHTWLAPCCSYLSCGRCIQEDGNRDVSSLGHTFPVLKMRSGVLNRSRKGRISLFVSIGGAQSAP